MVPGEIMGHGQDQVRPSLEPRTDSAPAAITGRIRAHWNSVPVALARVAQLRFGAQIKPMSLGLAD